MNDSATAIASSGVEPIVIAGVGMHPWGKWGRNFVEYGVHAARAALDDAGIPWSDVQFVAGADTMRNGYPGYVAGATFAQAQAYPELQRFSNVSVEGLILISIHQ